MLICTCRLHDLCDGLDHQRWPIPVDVMIAAVDDNELRIGGESGQMLLRWSPDRVVFTVSPAASTMSGWSSNEAAALSWALPAVLRASSLSTVLICCGRA